MCRAALTDLPEPVRSKIQQRLNEHRQENDEEERRHIIESIMTSNPFLNPIMMTPRASPHQEVLMGVRQFLRAGVPAAVIPHTVDLRIPVGESGAPPRPPPPGTIQEMTFGAMQRHLERLIGDLLTDEAEESEDESSLFPETGLTFRVTIGRQ